MLDGVSGGCVCAYYDWCGSFQACESVRIAPEWSPDKVPLSLALPLGGQDSSQFRLRHAPAHNGQRHPRIGFFFEPRC